MSSCPSRPPVCAHGSCSGRRRVTRTSGGGSGMPPTSSSQMMPIADPPSGMRSLRDDGGAWSWSGYEPVGSTAIMPGRKWYRRSPWPSRGERARQAPEPQGICGARAPSRIRPQSDQARDCASRGGWRAMIHSATGSPSGQEGCPQRWAASQNAMGRVPGGSCGVLHHVNGDPCARLTMAHGLGQP
jgi:hypothetical protein